MSEMLARTRLRRRGWTPAMVRDLLGAPDERRRNPVFASAPPMGLWDADRVAAAEAGPGFARRLGQSRTRSAAAAAAAGRKRADLITQASAIRIRVPQIPWDYLVRLACSHYNRLHADYDQTASAGDSPEFLQRISVNYLRHKHISFA